MSWGTSFNAEIYLIRESYPSKSLVEDAIAESEENISDAKQKIAMTIIGNAKDLFSTENSLLCEVQDFVETQIELIREESVKIYKLNLLFDFMTEGGTPVID